MSQIHPAAVIEPGARLHPSVIVGPFCHIGSNVEIGEGTVLDSHVRIFPGSRLGRHNQLHAGVVIGDLPQDIRFDPERLTGVEIGDHNVFRENVTVHRATRAENPTRIGSHNFLMNNSHVAHDCHVGDHNIFASGATLGGHVEISHHVFLSGHTAVHQFCRVGAYVMVSGLTAVVQDVPPYVTVDGHRGDIIGLNVVGLRRNGFDAAARQRIKAAYRTLYFGGLAREAALAALEGGELTPEIQQIAAFYRTSRRGVVGHRKPRGQAGSSENNSDFTAE